VEDDFGRGKPADIYFLTMVKFQERMLGQTPESSYSVCSGAKQASGRKSKSAPVRVVPG
jgi:hypothetical protein